MACHAIHEKERENDKRMKKILNTLYFTADIIREIKSRMEQAVIGSFLRNVAKIKSG